jgi:hypothetical protein
MIENKKSTKEQILELKKQIDNLNVFAYFFLFSILF